MQTPDGQPPEQQALAASIAIVGAGALGCVYGALLSASGFPVAFVVRPARAADSSPVSIQNAASSQRHTLHSPLRTATVPSHAPLVALAVRADNLDDDLLSLLAASPHVPVVSFTPLLPRALHALREATDGRLVVAMPGVVAYRNDAGVIRYWLPRAAPTLLDDSARGLPAVRSLLDAFGRAGVPARFEADVATMNPATTMTFLPLVVALDAAGGTVEGVLGEPALVKLSLAAVAECRKVASFVGSVPAWTRALTAFVGPRSLRLGAGLARRTFPESVRFVEQHFGSKTHAQNVLLAREVVALGKDHGLKMEALAELAERCARAGAHA